MFGHGARGSGIEDMSEGVAERHESFAAHAVQ